MAVDFSKAFSPKIRLFCSVEFPSKNLERAVNELSRFPGVGKKTALRLALFLLRQEEEVAHSMGNAIINLRSNVKYCNRCHNLSDSDTCNICTNPRRNQQTVCVVADLRDVIAIENTGLFTGLYHVLGGLIAPMEGIGPERLHIESLIHRVQYEGVTEVLLALSPTMEGDTTGFYISRKLEHLDVAVTAIARGVSIGGELEYADEITLGRSIVNRLPFKS